MKIFFFACFILTSSFSALAADAYTIDSRHTFPHFEINHLGFSTQHGRFNNTRGTVVVDKGVSNGGNINIIIDADSINTGLEELEDHLRSADFLDADRYPEIKFVSTQLLFNQYNLIAVDGNLTLHGVTRPVHLKVDFFHCDTHPITQKHVCGVNASTAIMRSEFGIDKYLPLIGNAVKITLQVEAIKD